MPPHFLASSRAESRLLFAGCLIISGVVSYYLASWAGQFAFGRQKTALDSEVGPHSLLIPSQAKLDLGTIPKGGAASATFWLHNPTDRVVELGEVTSSCPCLQVTPASRKVFPGQRISASASVDFADEASFVGKLLLEARGYARRETPSDTLGFPNIEEPCVFVVNLRLEVAQ